MELFWYAIFINLAEVSRKSGYRQATGSTAVPSVCSTHLSQASQITGSAALSFIFGYTDFPPASSVCWSLARGRQRKFSLFFSHYWNTYYGSGDTGEWNTESTDKDLPDQVRRQVIHMECNSKESKWHPALRNAPTYEDHLRRGALNRVHPCSQLAARALGCLDTGRGYTGHRCCYCWVTKSCLILLLPCGL